MMKSVVAALLVLSGFGSVAQNINRIKLAINDLSDCSATDDSLTFLFTTESKVYWEDSIYKVTQTADKKINYIFVYDTAEQIIMRFAWVPIPKSIYAGNLDSLIRFSDLIDTTENGIDFYVGPAAVSDYKYDGFLHPVGGAKKFPSGHLYRQFAKCLKGTDGMECEIIDRNSFCEINIPPYELWLNVSHETVVFKDRPK